ncbi:AAA family ATPase [Streptomyces niveus]|uniref:AAA family ATPase n=1 Tax=Streptomyces TaxID=1883 RepID=UPI001072756B|nr:LuxR family transcriptional regulator [Streptomyces sp. 4R-3d]TFI22095.1 helix-turn-helix transcriptional regulator [Streptomyces sp. 4R-3d]
MSNPSHESEAPLREARNVRSNEARRLRAALAPGDGTHILEIVGDPGAGKTHLLDGFAEDARKDGYRTLRGFGSEADQRTPLRALTRAVDERLVRDTAPRLPPAQTETVERIWAAAGAGDTEGLRAALARHDPAANLLALRALLERLAQDRPTLLVLDDFHWADLDTAELVDHLIRHPVGARLVIVLAHRNRQATEWLRGTGLRATLFHGVQRGTVERLELDALTTEQSAALLGRPANSPALRALHRDSHGIPQYLLALAHRKEREFLLELVHGEIQPLTRDEFAVAEAGSVVGLRFDVEALAAVSGLSLTRACTAAGGLLRRDLFRRVDSLAVLAFRHPLVGDAIYAGVDPCQRRTAHRLALAHQPKLGGPMAVRARHVAASLIVRDPGDLTILTRGAEEILRQDPETAVEWLQAALRSTEDPAERSEVLLLTARAQWSCGRPYEARAAIRAVADLGELAPAPRRWQSVAWGALLDCLAGRTGEAVVALENALADPAAVPGPERSRLLIWQSLVLLADGQVPSTKNLEHALRTAQLAGCARDTALALALRAHQAAAVAEVAAAREALDRVADDSCLAADWALGDEIVLLTLTGSAELDLGNFSAADTQFSRAADLACEQSFTVLLPPLLLGRAMVLYSTGRLEDARKLALRAAETGERMETVGQAALARLLALCCGIRRRPQDERATHWPELRERIDALRFGTLPHRVGTVLALGAALGDTAEASARAVEVVGAGGGSRLTEFPPRLRLEAFELLARVSAAERQPALLRWVRGAEKAARTLGTGYGRALAQCALGHQRRAEGRAADAARLYEHAAELFAADGAAGARTGMTLLSAHCLSMRGELRAEAEAATAERPARQVDLHLLTDREREVAGIAGTGVRTKDIATRLHLSPRTVDAHLNRIYRKLEVRSRTELAWLLADAV